MDRWRWSARCATRRNSRKEKEKNHQVPTYANHRALSSLDTFGDVRAPPFNNRRSTKIDRSRCRRHRLEIAKGKKKHADSKVSDESTEEISGQAVDDPLPARSLASLVPAASLSAPRTLFASARPWHGAYATILRYRCAKNDDDRSTAVVGSIGVKSLGVRLRRTRATSRETRAIGKTSRRDRKSVRRAAVRRTPRGSARLSSSCICASAISH